MLSSQNYPVYELTPQNTTNQNLWKVIYPPPKIYVQGTNRALQLLEHLPENGLAVVGTRHPTPKSVFLTRKWIQELAGTNLIIISGFARGIDATAHKAALDAGLPTIAILGAGLDIPYPFQNQDLKKQILAADSLIITEFPPQDEPKAGHFIKRNRLIAGFSKAVLVIEAGRQSGALNTASWGDRHDRQCFAVPCSPEDPAMAGNQFLLDGDKASYFWGSHCLGQVWTELSARKISAMSRKNYNKKQMPLNFPDDLQLTHIVASLTNKQGGAQVQQVLDWAIDQGWSPQRFFNALQKTLFERQLIDENGLLLKNP